MDFSINIGIINCLFNLKYIKEYLMGNWEIKIDVDLTSLYHMTPEELMFEVPCRFCPQTYIYGQINSGIT